MQHRTLLALACILVSSAALSATPPQKASSNVTCSQLLHEVDNYDKSQAAEFTAGIGDNSAPRETNRLLRTMIDVEGRQTAALLLAQNGCKPLETSNNWQVYISAAVACETARLGAKGQKEVPECVRENWTANAPK